MEVVSVAIRCGNPGHPVRRKVEIGRSRGSMSFFSTDLYALCVRHHDTHKAARREANYTRREKACKLVRKQQARREDTAIFKPEEKGQASQKTTKKKPSALAFNLATDHPICRRKRMRFQMLQFASETLHKPARHD